MDILATSKKQFLLECLLIFGAIFYFATIEENTETKAEQIERVRSELHTWQTTK